MLLVPKLLLLLRSVNLLGVKVKKVSLSMNKKSSQFSFLNAEEAKSIDDALMTQPGFSIDQLMELAGLAVAQSVHAFTSESFPEPERHNKVLVLCGPGNNGGDGLVTARHLKHFGYAPTVCYPRPGKGILFVNLVKQCADLDIAFISDAEVLNEIPIDSRLPYDIIVDALFGFSFSGPPKEPYMSLITTMANLSASGHGAQSVSVVSVDIPSGWHVEKGDVYNTSFVPNAVVSLTLPKECMRSYNGAHYLGGRFMPPAIAAQFGLTMPSYGFGSNQIIKLPSFSDGKCDDSSFLNDKMDTSSLLSDSERSAAKKAKNGDERIDPLGGTSLLPNSESSAAKKATNGDEKIDPQELPYVPPSEAVYDSQRARNMQAGFDKNILFKYITAPSHQQSTPDPLIYFTTPDCVVLFDLYPKAHIHLLIVPKRHFLPLLECRQLGAEHLPQLKTMHSLANRITEFHEVQQYLLHKSPHRRSGTPQQFLIGYHALPSLHPLHLHVISDDLYSPCLKSRKHYNSFVTPFLVSARTVENLLSTSSSGLHSRSLGSLLEPESVLNKYHKKIMYCNLCNANILSIPALKEHQELYHRLNA